MATTCLWAPACGARSPSCLPPGARRVTVVTQAGIGVEVDPGVPFQVVTIPDGERAKSLATVEEICRFMARNDMHRSDVVVAVGGGVVTDVAGYAASSYHRGVAVINVPTTLLGQVDAAIGGKTGVNLPEGKNLVGSFWQPLGVFCDTETLASLPAREWRSGHGEMAKYAFLGVEDLDSPGPRRAGGPVRRLQGRGRRQRRTRRRSPDDPELRSHLGPCPRGSRFRQRGRDLLRPSFVTAKRLASASCSRRSSRDSMGRIGTSRVERHRRVVAGYDLPVSLPSGADPAALVRFMTRDKKSAGGLTFMLDGPHGVEAVHDVRAQLVFEALDALEGDR